MKNGVAISTSNYDWDKVYNYMYTYKEWCKGTKYFTKAEILLHGKLIMFAHKAAAKTR